MLNILRGFVSRPEPTNKSLAIQGHAHVQLQIQNEHNISNTSAVATQVYERSNTHLPVLQLKWMHDVQNKQLFLLNRLLNFCTLCCFLDKKTWLHKGTFT